MIRSNAFYSAKGRQPLHSRYSECEFFPLRAADDQFWYIEIMHLCPYLCYNSNVQGRVWSYHLCLFWCRFQFSYWVGRAKVYRVDTG